MRYLLILIMFAIIGCGDDCNSVSDKTYAAPESGTFYCTQIEEPFDLDAEPLVKRFAGGTATLSPCADPGGCDTPDYIPDIITIGQLAKCDIHLETVDVDGTCTTKDHFTLHFDPVEDYMKEITYAQYDINDELVYELVAWLTVVLDDGATCSLHLPADIADGDQCWVDCMKMPEVETGDPVVVPVYSYKFIWHAPE